LNKYAHCAIEAVGLIASSKAASPRQAWEQSSSAVFGKGTSSQQKGCPRDAFLGLCEAGFVQGVAPGKYCNSILNKQYAVSAVQLLRKKPGAEVAPTELWGLVLRGNTKVHNSQMDVVLGLWNSGLISADDGQGAA
jgi:hypothetical protein